MTLRRRTSCRDRVTPEVALAVFARDGGCIAPRLGGSFMDCWGRNRIEHVQKDYGRMGRRAESIVPIGPGRDRQQDQQDTDADVAPHAARAAAGWPTTDRPP